MRERVWLVFGRKAVEVRNLSEDPYSFETDPEEIAKLLVTFGEPTAIVHTHEHSCCPSPKDLESMKAWRVTWVIVSRHCVKAFRLDSGGSLEEVNVDPLLLEVLDDLLVELG